MIGATTLSLPYYASKTAGSDGWISIIIAGIAIHVLVLVIWLLSKRFPHLTLYDYSCIILGKPFGFILNLAYICYFLFVVANAFIHMTDILGRWIFPQTPNPVLFFMGLLIFFYGCTGTLNNLVSLFSVIFYFTLILCVISFFTLFDPVLDIRFILPVGSSGWDNILGGVVDVLPAFIGFELLLIYMGFVLYPKKLSSTKGAMVGIGVVTFYYATTTIISMMMFSQEEMEIIPEPVLYMLRTITVSVLQRWELIFLTIWCAVVIVFVLSFGYVASMGASKTFHTKHVIGVLISTIVVGSFTLIIHYWIEPTDLKIIAQFFHVTFAIVIPILLLGISIIFKKKGENAT